MWCFSTRVMTNACLIGSEMLVTTSSGSSVDPYNMSFGSFQFTCYSGPSTFRAWPSCARCWKYLHMTMTGTCHRSWGRQTTCQTYLMSRSHNQLWVKLSRRTTALSRNSLAGHSHCITRMRSSKSEIVWTCLATHLKVAPPRTPPTNCMTLVPCQPFLAPP